jgi:hypothetical protein
MTQQTTCMDLSGMRYGRLSVVKYVGRTKSRETVWMCICDCGRKTITRSAALKSGHIDKVFSTIRHNLAGRVFHSTPTTSIGDLINDGERKTLQIKILCASAEKPCEVCGPAGKYIGTSDYGNTRLFYRVSGSYLQVFDEEYPGFIDNIPIQHCPGCGRRIERSDTV